MKVRGNERVNSLEVTNVDKHRRQRGANHAIVVAPGFTPKVTNNAETTKRARRAKDGVSRVVSCATQGREYE